MRVGVDFFREQFWPETEHQQAHEQERVRQLAPGVRGVRKGIPFFRQRPVQDVANGARHVDTADDQRTPQSNDRDGWEHFPGTEKHRGFADEIRKAGKTAAGHRSHQQGRADKRQPAAEAAERADFQRAGLLVNEAAQREGQRREETVRDHDQHRAGDADEVQAGDPEENEAHVRHAGIADEQVQIFLAHRDPADIQNISDAEPRDDVRPALRSLRQEWQRDTDQTVQAELFQHARVQHGGG